MKKLLLLLCVFALIVQSCETSGLESAEQSFENVDLKKIESLKSMNENSQRVAFRLLNHEEKYTFRLTFINEFIRNNELNNYQLELIKELKLNFNSNLFLKNDEAEYFKSIFVVEWLNKAENHFTFNELLQIAANPYKSKDSLSLDIQKQANCTCVEGGFFGCKKKTITHVGTDEVSVEVETVPCDGPYACTSPTDENGVYETGCGWFWMEICDGSC